MPWLSRSPSPAVSPRASSPGAMASAPVTYIPPLIDGACGTVPRAQLAVWPSLRHDIAEMWKIMPGLFRAAWGECLPRLRGRTWADYGDVLTHLALSFVEVYMLVSIIPLWVALPGVMFAGWLALCTAAVYGLSRLLNGAARDQIIKCSSGSDSWMMGQEIDDERWIFVGGMGVSSRHLSRSTLPMLSKLFSRSVTAVHMPTYGFPFDMICLLLQRAMATPMPTSGHRLLYHRIRTALIDSSIHRAVIIAHNTGSIPVSQIISRLCADIPADKLSKLEVYTFGAAAHEFIVPVGEHLADQQQGKIAEAQRSVHMEHFALANDPFAQFGVLQSVRHSLESRFCGGVFVMNTNKNGRNRLQGKGSKAPIVPPSGLVLSDYMRALFPAQLFNSESSSSSVLDTVMMIDRDTAEKREFAAMANYASSRSKNESKRLSWTALGATVGRKNGVSDGIVGLEMARRGCRDCEGHRGSELSWLVRYVHIGSPPPLFVDAKE